MHNTPPFIMVAHRSTSLIFILSCLSTVLQAPVDPSPADTVDYWRSGQRELQYMVDRNPAVTAAKNVIFFIGDGMGMSTESAARIYHEQLRNLSGHPGLLSWQRTSITGTVEVSTTNFYVPDSAGSTTAFLTGWKTRTGTIGVNSRVPRGDCVSAATNKLRSTLQYSIDAGKWTGVVSTARVTHATPASAFAWSANRDWESDAELPERCRGMQDGQYLYPDIASQLVDDNTASQIRVVMGGGRRSFYPAGTPDPEGGDQGRRLDDRTLVEEWVEQKSQLTGSPERVAYVMNETEFNNVDPETTDYLLGLFEASHMQYEIDRTDPGIEQAGEPSLAAMTEKAIRILQKSEKGYFLLVEAGRIDHAHHANLAVKALNDTVAMSDAVEMAKQLTDETDTLIIISADHSHPFSLSGYPSKGWNILGNVDNQTHDELALAEDDKPWTALSYANGPGFLYHRVEDGVEVPRRNTTTDATLGTKDFVYDAAVPLHVETHSGEDVALYALGPMSDLLVGHHKNIHVAHVMMYASCVGPGLTFCDNPPQDNSDNSDSGSRGSREELTRTEAPALDTTTSSASRPVSHAQYLASVPLLMLYML